MKDLVVFRVDDHNPFVRNCIALPTRQLWQVIARVIVQINKITVPYAGGSVGGFLCMGAHHDVVAAAALELTDKRLTLSHAIKESLKALLDFVFAK